MLHHTTLQYVALFTLAADLITIPGLACRNRERQAPFERISAKQSDFIDAEYVPNNMKIKDPRSMKLDHMVSFFEHIAEREASEGIANAFRFKAILSSRKKGSLRPAQYKEVGAESGDDTGIGTAPAPARRRKKQRDMTLTEEGTAPTNARLYQAPSNEQVTESGVGAGPLFSTGLLSPSNTPAPSPSIPSTRGSTTENSSSGMPQSQGNLTVPSSTTGLFTPEDSPAPLATGAARPDAVTRRKVKSPNELLLEEAGRYGSQGRRRR
jgi:hypothetical protein